MEPIGRPESGERRTGAWKGGMVLAVVCLLFLVPGCSSVMKVTTVDPDVSPQNAGSLLKKEVKVAIDDFRDARREQRDRVIGVARLGVTNYPADVVSDAPVGTLVARAMAKGFKSSGFLVSGRDDADLLVGGTVDRFWVQEFVSGFGTEYSRAEVKYDLSVKRPTGVAVWSGTIEVAKTSRTAFDTTKNDMPTLTAALKEAVESVFARDDFRAALAGDPAEK